jgi:hypothetical protein
MKVHACCQLLLLRLCCINIDVTNATDRPAVFRRSFFPQPQRHAEDDKQEPSNGWFRTIPALRFPRDDRSQTENTSLKRSMSLPNIPLDMDYFMGITPQTSRSFFPTKRSKSSKRQRKIINVRDSLCDALDEIQQLRKELNELRREIKGLKDPTPDSQSEYERRFKARRKLFHGVDQQIEAWAEKILFREFDDTVMTDGEVGKGVRGGGVDATERWTDVQCHKMLRNRYNADGRTCAHLKWQRDSRGSSNNSGSNNNDDDDDGNDESDSQPWPMIRMYSTIDAPIAEVALYLSDKNHMTDYNSLMEKHKDLEELTPRSKICWGRTPQILFVKPRDFVTYCAYRWRHDGSLVIVNQALDEYEDTKANAFAFRGATFIGPDAEDPEKTKIAMLAHACPGLDVPAWSCRMAIQTLAPVEPYRLFHKINEGVTQSRSRLQTMLQERSSEVSSSKLHRPAGIAQMGYACFWPDGAPEEDSSTDVLDGLE